MKTTLVLGCACLTALASQAHAQSSRSLSAYGEATPGSGGIAPQLWASTTPRPGEASFRLLIDDGNGGSSFVPLLSAAPADILLNNLRLLLAPGALFVGPSGTLSGAGPGNGSGSVALPIPNLPSLIGGAAFAQTLIADPGAPQPFGLAATRGLEIAPVPFARIVATVESETPNDPQFIIDPATNTVTQYGAGVVNGSTGASWLADSRYAVQTTVAPGGLLAWDMTTTPPTLVGNTLTTSAGNPWMVQTHPDGRRLYSVGIDFFGGTPAVEVFDGDPTQSGFFRPHPGGDIPLGTLIDAVDLQFDPSGAHGYLAIWGFLSRQPQVRKIDTRFGSPTYHQVEGVFTPRQRRTVNAIAVNRDGTRLYAHIGNSGASGGEIAIVDTATMTAIDVDAGAPGVQNIGGELSVAPTPIKRESLAIVLDPRERVLFIANNDSVDRLAIDPARTDFRTLLRRAVPGGRAVVGLDVSAAGDRLYLGSCGVREFDAATLTPLRHWQLPFCVARVIAR